MNDIGTLVSLEKKFEDIAGLLAVDQFASEYFKNELYVTVSVVKDKFKLNGLINAPLASDVMLKEMDHIMGICSDLRKGEISEPVAIRQLMLLKIGEKRFGSVVKYISKGGIAASSTIISWQLSILYSTIMEFIKYMCSQGTSFIPIMIGGDAYGQERDEILSILTGSFTGKALAVYENIKTGDVVGVLKSMYNAITNSITPSDYFKSYSALNKALNTQEIVRELASESYGSSWAWSFVNKAADAVSKGAAALKSSVTGSRERAFVVELKGKVDSTELLIQEALYRIFILTCLIVVLTIIIIVVNRVTKRGIDKRMEQRRAERGLPAITFRFMDKKPAKKSKRKPKSRSKPVKTSPAKRRCNKQLSEKIGINIREGRYSSRKQAIAVAYNQVRKKSPSCKKFFNRSKKATKKSSKRR